MDIETLTKKLEATNNEIIELKKAQNSAGMMTTGQSPNSMQVTYTPELQTKVFENAPYYRFLESKGRVGDVSSSDVAFYTEEDNSIIEWIKEDADIPDAVASNYTEQLERMKTLIYPIDIGLMAQMGNHAVDLMSREIEKGFIKIANTMDTTLLEGKGTESSNDFKGLCKTIPSGNQEKLKDGILTEDVIDDMLVKLVDENGSNVDCIVTTYGVGKVLKKIVAPYRRYNDKIDIGLGHRVTSYESITGAEIPILIDSNMSKDCMYFVDSSSIEVKRLLAPTVFNNLPTNKLGTRNAIVSFATAQNIAPHRDGCISGIGVADSLEEITTPPANGDGS